MMMKANQLERRQKRVEQNILMMPVDGSSTANYSSLKMPLNTTMQKLDQGIYLRHDQLSEWDKSNFEKIFKGMDGYGSI